MVLSQYQIAIGNRLKRIEENPITKEKSYQNFIIFVDFSKELENIVHSVIFHLPNYYSPNQLAVCAAPYQMENTLKYSNNIQNNLNNQNINIEITIFFGNGYSQIFSHSICCEETQNNNNLITHEIDKALLSSGSVNQTEEILITIEFLNSSLFDLTSDDNSSNLKFGFKNQNIWKYGVQNIVHSIDCKMTEDIGENQSPQPQHQWNINKPPYLITNIPIVLDPSKIIIFSGRIYFTDKSNLPFTYTITPPYHPHTLIHQIQHPPPLSIVPRLYLFHGNYKIRYKLRKLGFVAHPITFAVLLVPSQNDPLILETTVNGKFEPNRKCSVENNCLKLSFGGNFSGEYNGEIFTGSAPNGSFQTYLIDTAEFNWNSGINWLVFFPLNIIERVLLYLTKELVQRYGVKIWYFPPEYCSLLEELNWSRDHPVMDNVLGLFKTNSLSETDLHRIPEILTKVLRKHYTIANWINYDESTMNNKYEIFPKNCLPFLKSQFIKILSGWEKSSTERIRHIERIREIRNKEGRYLFAPERILFFFVLKYSPVFANRSLPKEIISLICSNFQQPIYGGSYYGHKVNFGHNDLAGIVLTLHLNFCKQSFELQHLRWSKTNSSKTASRSVDIQTIVRTSHRMKGIFQLNGLEGCLITQKYYQLKSDYNTLSKHNPWTKIEKNGKKEKNQKFIIKEDWLNGGAMLYFTHMGGMLNVTIYGLTEKDYKNMNSVDAIVSSEDSADIYGQNYEYWTDHSSTLNRIVLSDY